MGRFVIRVFVGLILLLIVGEVLASFFVVRAFELVHPHPQLNHVWPASSSFVHKEFALKDYRFPEPYTHFYNKQSWLEKYDLKKEKGRDTYRIFYVGDSFTEGTVDMEGSVPSLIESWLNKLHGSVKFEVVNTGTTSYSPLIYYILTKYFIAPYKPDLVVINVDMTDLYDDWVYAKTLVRDEEGDPFAVPPRDVIAAKTFETKQGLVPNSFVSRVRLYLYRYSYLYNLAQRIREDISQRNLNRKNSQSVGGDRQRWSWMKKERSRWTDSQLSFTLDNIKRLADFCSENSIKLLLTGVPHKEQFEVGESSWSSQPHLDLEKLAEKKGILYFNSFEMVLPVIERSSVEKYYYNDDMHFNPEGYKLWACAHWRALEKFKDQLFPDNIYFDEVSTPCDSFY